MQDDGDKRRPLRIIIATGGTGGHLYPGLALAKELQTRWKADILFIGTAYGIENKILPTMPYKYKKIWMRGLQRKASMANFLFPIRLMVSLVQCAVIFLTFRPQVVIGCGGYVSGPPLMMGLAMRIPTVIQEQNSYPGLVNRFLGNRVGQVHLTFEDSKKFFGQQRRLFVSGNPVNSNLGTLDKQKATAKFGLQPNKMTLLIFGGSHGAKAINHTLLQSIEDFKKLTKLQFLWITGPADYENIKQSIPVMLNNITLRPYIEEMAWAYAAADMVLCRSGATTLAEIALCKLPAILIPYPHAAENHQLYNARSMEQAGAAIIIEEQHLSPKNVLERLTELIQNEAKRTSMSLAAEKFARPQAARDIANLIMQLITSGGEK